MNSILLAIVLTAAAYTSNVEYIGVTPDNINGLPMKSPQGLAVNPAGTEFLVADALNDRILIFDTTGTPVFDFPLGDNRQNPFGVMVDSADEVIVGAMDRPVLWVYDYYGRFIEDVPLPGGVLPGRLEAGINNTILVVNRMGKEVLLLERGGNLLARYQSADVQCKPSGICREKDGALLLISSANDAVSFFDSAGQPGKSFGGHGRKPEDFSFPSAAAIDDYGGIWVVDSFRHELKHFDSNHKFVNILGQRGTGHGEFFFPTDIKIAAGGKMGVLEKGSGRLQIFRIKDEK